MIISIDEAKDTLRIDNNYNDEIIESLIIAIPDYLEIHCGNRFENKNIKGFELAKTLSKQLLKLWYFESDKHSDNLKRTIDSLTSSLSHIVSSQGDL